VERAARYGAALHVPFPILADPEHAVYRRFDLDRAYLLIQRTASVVVDRHGRIQYLRRATNPMAWLQESQELLEVVRRPSDA
jgi:peroxiredoxin